MKDIRLGRSLDSTLPGCDELLPADWVWSEAVLSRDSSAGWAGNSFICSGSRRTRLANGAIVGVRRVVAAGCWGRRQRQRNIQNGLVEYLVVIVTSKEEFYTSINNVVTLL